MLSETTIRELVSTPSFVNNASKLSYMLHISHQDASQELLIELLDHRLRTWTDKNVATAVKKDLPSLKWKIKYSRKDIVRQYNKDANRELAKSQMLAGMEPQESNQSETLEALERLPLLFKNKATQAWCESILRVGKGQTLANFNQTSRQFSSKLAKTCKYARQHRQPKQSSHTEELRLLKEWDNLMADEQTDDSIVQTFIDQHKEYIDKIIDDPQVAFQGRLIKNFSAAGEDKYVLANLMAKREQELRGANK